MEKKCRLLEHNGLYGFFRYVSMFGSRASGNYQQARDAELVYRFKKQGRNAELFGAMIRGVAANFGCGVILACPGHTQAETQLQKLLGGDLLRTAEVKSRKYSHKNEIDYAGEAATLELRRNIGGQRVLFVDDVATTGRTVGFYRRFLTEHGATEVVCLVLGINERLNPTEADFEITYTTADAKTGAERAAAHVAKHQDIAADLDAAIAGIDWKSRRRAERDFPYFLKIYCTSKDPNDGAFLEIPPPKELQPIARDMEQAIGDASIPYHIRVARGLAKTSYTKGAVLWTSTTGLRHFIVGVGANDENAENIIEDVFSCITQNPKYIRDFPEVSVPFLRLEGAYQRAKTQKYHGKATKPQKSAGKIVLPTVIDPRTGQPFPSSGAILEAVGFNAGARGKVKGILRPDFLILDDLQNDERAQSEGQVAKMAAKIKKTFMGLAGHRKKIAAIMTSTPIEADDLSETFANDPGWKTKTYKLMKSWPKCHNPEATPEERKGVRDYWEEYWEIFQAEKAADRVPHIAANRFYRKHRKEMDDGAEVLNPHNFDPKTEVSGIQHAMNIMFRDGLDTFMSEYQMQPPRNAFAFELTARHILSRIRRGVPPKTIPPATVFTAAATDINPGYAITTAITAFDIRLTALVTAYHVTRIRIPENLNDTEFNARLFAALKAHAREIVAQGIRLDKWGIDAGGRQFNTVTAFAPTVSAEFGIEAVAMLGRAGQNWNPTVRSRIRSEKNATILCRDPQGRRWLAWNADEYKEKMHLAWATEPGADGGLSLFDGNANHYRFAVQVANEKLKAKTRVKSNDGKERFAYKWQTKNPHDFGDCLAMCYALAGAEGLTWEGEIMPKKKTRLAIGGKIVGATPPPEDPITKEGAAVCLKNEAGVKPPPIQKKRRRIAIGGRLV